MHRGESYLRGVQSFLLQLMLEIVGGLQRLFPAAHLADNTEHAEAEGEAETMGQDLQKVGNFLVFLEGRPGRTAFQGRVEEKKAQLRADRRLLEK